MEGLPLRVTDHSQPYPHPTFGFRIPGGLSLNLQISPWVRRLTAILVRVLKSSPSDLSPWENLFSNLQLDPVRLD